jgi:hypothetical protein
MRKLFEMTDEQFEEIKKACQPVTYLVVGGMPPSSPQENANNAWAALGRELGFKHMTVKPEGSDQKRFTAEVVGEEDDADQV